MAISLTLLQTYVGKTMDEICENQFTTSAQNHCAHFVSHVLDLQLGMLCGDMKYETRHTGASVRCDELYNLLPSRGDWEDKPMAADGILIFITSAKNVRGKVMGDSPQKHVGIYHSGKVFNFSGKLHQVVRDDTVEKFFDKIDGIYRDNDLTLYYGVPVVIPALTVSKT